MNKYNETIEIECFDIGNYIAEVEIWAHETDASFSHEFGIKKETEIEIDDSLILSITDDDGGDVEVSPADEKTIRMWAEEKFIEKWRDGYYD